MNQNLLRRAWSSEYQDHFTAGKHNPDRWVEPRVFAPFSGVRSLAGQYTESVKGAYITLTDVVSVAPSDVHASIKADPEIDMDPHSSAVLERVKVLLGRLSGHSLGLFGTEVLQMVNSNGEEGDGPLRVVECHE